MRISSIDEWRVTSSDKQLSGRTTATFTLDQLEQWTREFLADSGGNGSNDMEDRLRLSSFLCWVRQNKGGG